MSVLTIHEDEVEAFDLPGWHLRWLFTESRLGAKYSSACVISVAPGETVRPAHCHPNGEEVIDIITGNGRVLVDGEIAPVAAGSIVLFPQAAIHILQNTGTTDMKVICFFAPRTSLENYRFFGVYRFPSMNFSAQFRDRLAHVRKSISPQI